VAQGGVIDTVVQPPASFNSLGRANQLQEYLFICHNEFLIMLFSFVFSCYICICCKERNKKLYSMEYSFIFSR
jgi:hypothetical protein